MRSKKQTGDVFEQEIAEIYRAMGYEISQHLPISGQEVDIFATRQIPGGGLYSVIVECKYKGNGALASNADVQSIAGAFSIMKTQNLASACTLVTSNGFSLSAKQAALAAGIHLTTKRELTKALIDFSSYVNEVKARYSEDFGVGRDSWHIDARGRVGNTEIHSLDNLVDDWLKKSKKSPLAILGGYGTGKTSFCRHYAVRLMEKAESPVPVIISLREFQKAVRIESLIRDFLDEQCNAPAPRFDTFWKMYTEGLLLIIFDGLDEMATRVDSSIIEMNLMEIERFARDIGNVILTCRPEFFVSRKEEASALHPIDEPLSERMALYQRINIDLWAPEQVTNYVEKRVRGMKPPPSESPAYYLERINRLPELSDMSVRAVHLDLIVKMLPKMMKDGIPITRTNLYRTYILRESRREIIQNKRLRIISDEDRLALMRTVAAERFFGSYDDLDFESASKIIKDRLGLPTSDVESATRDFLNRSFLHRNGDTYSFAHKSMGEYLFAVEVYEMIKRNNPRYRLTTNYSAAVAGMILELFGGLGAYDNMLGALGLNRVDTGVTIDNLSSVLLASLSLMDHLHTLRSLRPQEFPQNEERIWRRFLGLTHDLNNNIGLIRVNVELLGEERTSNKDSAETLGRLTTAWKNALSRLDELQRFEFDRLNSTLEFRLKKKWVDISALLRIAVSSIPEGRVQVSGESNVYWGDENLLSRIFENLAMNAKHATGTRGKLAVKVVNDDTGLQVSFENTGPQIPTDLMDKIFEFGFTTRRDGQGIGLYNVKDLVELHGGMLKVSSTAAKTVFEVFLPAPDTRNANQ